MSVRSLITPLLVSAVLVGCSDPPADLVEAVSRGDVIGARELLEEGADPDLPLTLGLTPLMRAANRNDVEMTRLLIDAGANLDAGNDGISAIHIAAGADANDVLEVLLEAGADPTARSASGMNALDFAAESGATRVLETLVERAGMDIDQLSEVITQGHGYPRNVGPTPLEIAVRSGRLETVRKLLSLGADVNARSTAGQTPLLIAVFSDQSVEMVAVLLEAGADPAASARCDLGCSVGEGSPLTVGEWVAQLKRDALADLLPAS